MTSSIKSNLVLLFQEVNEERDHPHIWGILLACSHRHIQRPFPDLQNEGKLTQRRLADTVSWPLSEEGSSRTSRQYPQKIAIMRVEKIASQQKEDSHEQHVSLGLSSITGSVR